MLSLSFMHQIFNMPFVSKNFITLLHSTAVSSPQSPPFVQLFFFGLLLSSSSLD